MSIIAVTDANFEAEVLESKLPVLVDFWAEWCQPCKMLAPIFEEVAAELSDKVKFVKMNVDGQDTPANYKVRGIPALYIFVDGELKTQTHGALSKTDLLAFVQETLEQES